MSEPVFQLPRRGREQYDNTKVLVAHLNWMENRIMAALETVVEELRSAIANANIRFQNVGQLEAAVAAERAQYDALVAAEDAEDVQQNQELADAKAATDNALAQVQGLSDTLTGLTESVNQLGTTPVQPPADGSAESAPADSTPAPAAPTPDAAPADAPAADTPTDTPAPAEAPVDTPAPAEAPTEAPAADAPVADAPAADAPAAGA